MVPMVLATPLTSCRSPRGERGLKYRNHGRFRKVYLWSLPPRGAWIEIANRSAPAAKHSASLPPRGAWIEMSKVAGWPAVERTGRSPRGERGLK